MSAWVRPLLALGGVLLAAGALAGFEAATRSVRPDSIRSALVAAGAALMSLGLTGLALTASSRPWADLLLAGTLAELAFAVADTALRRRAGP